MLPVKKFKKISDDLKDMDYEVALANMQNRSVNTKYFPSMTILNKLTFNHIKIVNYQEIGRPDRRNPYTGKMITVRGEVSPVVGPNREMEFYIEVPCEANDCSLKEADFQIINGKVSGSAYVSMIAKLNSQTNLTLVNSLFHDPVDIQISNLSQVVEICHEHMQRNLDQCSIHEANMFYENRPFCIITSDKPKYPLLQQIVWHADRR